MSRLPLTYVVSCATLQLLARVLRNKLVPRPFRALHKKFWFTYNIRELKQDDDDAQDDAQ